MLSRNYDGLQNDLDKMDGVFLKRGEYTSPLDNDRLWDFKPLAKAGDTVEGPVVRVARDADPDALTAARMLARGAAPIHLTVTGATAARYASQASQSASS